MKKDSIKQTPESRPTWATLEDWVRGQVQGWIQRVLEDEVTEFVGRPKSQRQAAVDASAGYRNGYGKPRRLTLRCGTPPDSFYTPIDKTSESGTADNLQEHFREAPQPPREQE